VGTARPAHVIHPQSPFSQNPDHQGMSAMPTTASLAVMMMIATDQHQGCNASWVLVLRPAESV
jgi:hypothetical protein